MNTAMQELQEWLNSPNEWSENNFSVRQKVEQLLKKEKEIIIQTFDTANKIGINSNWSGKEYYDIHYDT